jgi:hypothetical protein
VNESISSGLRTKRVIIDPLVSMSGKIEKSAHENHRTRDEDARAQNQADNALNAAISDLWLSHMRPPSPFTII